MALYMTILMWLLLLLFLPLVILTKNIRAKRQLKQLPPGPPKLPIIGNLHQIAGTLPHRTLWQLSKKYGPVMLLKFGSIPTLVVSSVETAREVLKTHDLDCCSRPQLTSPGKLSYNYIDVGFAPYGDYWKEMRKIFVLELFSAKRVQSFQFIREEEVSLLISSIAQLSSSGSPVDFNEKMLSLTANITCRIVFGKSFRGSGFNGDRFQQLIFEAVALLASPPSAADFFPSVGWIIDRLTGLHGRLKMTSREFDDFYKKVIDDHLNTGRTKPDQEDIIDILLRIERNETQLGTIKFTRDQTKAILMDLFLAGVDASAITIEWAMTELAKKPTAMQNAQDEVRNCVGKKGIVSESDLDQLPFLKMVVKETLRLHPPGALLIPRETLSYFKLNGYDIDPKTRVHVNVYAIGRDPNIWKDPEEFMPERFSDSSIDFKGQDFELLPFGAGRRICAGMNMGALTVELALANLLYHFDWKLPDGMKEEDIDVEEVAGITIHKKFALKLVPIIHH